MNKLAQMGKNKENGTSVGQGGTEEDPKIKRNKKTAPKNKREDEHIAFWNTFYQKCKLKGPSKLPAANSRSGSTEGHGANGYLFSMGVLSVVCRFSLKLDAKKHGRRRNKL